MLRLPLPGPQAAGAANGALATDGRGRPGPAPAVGLALVLALGGGWSAPAAALQGSPTRAAHASPGAKARKSAPASAPAYGSRAEVVAYAADLAQRSQLPQPWILSQLAQARRMQAVRQLIMPPPVGTAKNWAAYRARFIEPRRIDAGLAFWQNHQDVLARTEARSGVPAAIVVAIIGVETFYGRVTGGFRVIDALATLSFDFPPGRSDRSAYFRGELEAFLSMCAREGMDPQAVKGSFAGAIGLPQFMPSSLNRLAVDGDGDGRIDLLNSPADAIASVAHFLAEHGWQRGLATHFDVLPPADAGERALLLAPDIEPSFSAAQLRAHGATLPDQGADQAGALALIELHNGERAASYMAGTNNFRVLTHYNRSSYYAMAVIELAQALSQGRSAGTR
jgi:membrane-bound lytic murein transglycosylase B